VTELTVIRNNRHLIATSRDGKVYLAIGWHNPATGKTQNTKTVVIHGRSLDYLYAALIHADCLDPAGNVRLHLKHHTIFVKWEDSSRKFTVVEHKDNDRIVLRLSPTDSYNLAALCRRTADWAFLKEMMDDSRNSS